VRCDFTNSLLQGYFDGELSGRRAAELERHLRRCVHCATELVDLDLLRDRLQLAQLYEPATASVRRRISARLHAIAPTTAASRPLLWHWLAAAAALLFVAVLLWRVGYGPRGDDYQPELAEEVVDAHVQSLQLGRLTAINSTDEQAVKGWFTGKLTFVFPVRDFANDGFALQGGRLDVVEGRSVAALVYARPEHQIDVFIWPTREQDTSPRVGSRQGNQWIDWRKGRIEFCAVSYAPTSDLQQLQRLLTK